MAEESERLATVAVAEALAEVNRCRVNIENIEKNIQNIEKNIRNIENRSDFTGDEPGYKNLIDRLDKARADLDKARADLDKARADLDKAREYHLQLNQLSNVGLKSIIAPALFVRPSQASFTSISGSFWHSSPINHRIAFEALTMMQETNVENTCFDLCAKEILETLSRANSHVDSAGIFFYQMKAHGEISMTAMLTEIIARTLVSSENGLRWYHQLQDPADGVVDVALFAVREKGYARGLQIPCSIFEIGLNESPESKRWQTFAYLINLSHLLDAEYQALLSVELILNFTRHHSMSLRCTTLTGQAALWNSTIWSGEVTETTLARVLSVLVKNAERNAKTVEVDWQVLGSNCALDRLTGKVYKCYDYRYRDPDDKRSATYYMKYLNAKPVVQFDNLLVITYDYIVGSHVPKNTSDFVPILKMLGALHADHVVHGDIRLSNIVFAEDQSSLIDFDFSGERGVKKYPEGYNCEILDGFRHADAKENAFLEIEHDFHALARLMNLFSTTEKSEEWSAVRVAVSNGEIGSAVQLLDELKVPIRCADSALMNQLNATGSLQKKQSYKKRRQT